MKRLLIIFLSLMFLTSCSHVHRFFTSHNTLPISKKNILLPFHRVHIAGDINVILHTHSHKPGVVIISENGDAEHVIYHVQDSTLYVELDQRHKFNNIPTIEINTRYLTDFVYVGNGSIIGENLQTNVLNLQINNSGNTNLSGKIGLRSLKTSGSGAFVINGINTKFLTLNLGGSTHLSLKGVVNVASCRMTGASWLSLYWVKSHYLTVRNKGNSFVQMAGVADTLDVELWGQARFHGQYLRGRRSFVKTHDRSQAEIFVVHSQHTLANDDSNIYVYNLPTMRANFMGKNGSILDMREWGNPLIQEPTPYNL